MKNYFKKSILFFVPFLILGCSDGFVEDNSKANNEVPSNKNDNNKNNEAHKHLFTSAYMFDENEHWQRCVDDDCDEIQNKAPHEFGEWTYLNPSSLTTREFDKFAKVKAKKCKTCDFAIPESGLEEDFPLNDVLPELRFTTTAGTSFATKPTKDGTEVREEPTGTFSLSNCKEKYQFSNVAGTMKVRGNQTAGWKKKGFRMKFDSKQNVLGLNNGNKFKKWVLFADAKDTALIRTSLGLYLSRRICSDNTWVSDFMPVNLYINDQYWGYYILAEQKEVKKNRIALPEPEENYAGDDIAYCFELDYYGQNEYKKADGGDPVFSVDYKPKRMDYRIEQNLAPGNVTTYTMLSDITNKTTQLSFIKKKVENLYTVLYEGAKNNKPKKINGDSVTDWTGASFETVIREYFDVDSFAEGFIINELDCAPDVGYSSFYMAFDNTADGAKKLKFENPWDFDSNFGNRSNFIVNADDNYLARSSNMWLHLLGKFDFFMDIVKEKWNQLRDSGALEMSFHMMNSYFSKYDADYKKNFQKWPTNDAAYEVRDPFKNTSDYKKAQAETINWLSKRVNYLEKQWGKDRPNIITTDK